MDKSEIGKMAYLGDVWYQIMDIREGENGIEYALFSRTEWVPKSWIKGIYAKGNTNEYYQALNRAKQQGESI